MKTRELSGRSDLTALLDHVLPGGAGGSSVPLHVAVELGETCTTHPDGSARRKLNGSCTLIVRVKGGAKDN